MLYLGRAPPLTVYTTVVVGTIINYYSIVPSLTDKGKTIPKTVVVSQQTIIGEESLPPISHEEYIPSLTKKIRSLEEVTVQ